MDGIMADADVKGQFGILMGIINGPVWHEFWEHLGINLFKFDDFGLAEDSSDALVWRTCQKHEIVLVTGNRNKGGADSLEAVLARENDRSKLPVVTLADVHRIPRSKAY